MPQALAAAQDRDAPVEGAVGDLARERIFAGDEAHRHVGGNWLACTAARTRAGVVPETPIGTGPVEALPAKAKPRMAAMARAPRAP